MLINLLYVLWLVLMPVICHTPSEEILSNEPNQLTGCIVIFQPHTDPSTPEQTNEMNTHIRSLMNSYRGFVENDLDNTVKFEYSTLFYGLAIEFNNLYKIHDVISQSQQSTTLDIDDYQQMETAIKKLFEDYKKDELAKYDINLVYQSDTLVSVDEPMM